MYFRLCQVMTPLGELGLEVIQLLVIAIPIASISWTITHEEIFREPREFCARCSKQARHLLQRKFFYLFTCEYCFSHWVAVLFLLITHYRLIYQDWRGSLLGFFALVWMANQYITIFDRRIYHAQSTINAPSNSLSSSVVQLMLVANRSKRDRQRYEISNLRDADIPREFQARTDRRDRSRRKWPSNSGA